MDLLIKKNGRWFINLEYLNKQVDSNHDTVSIAKDMIFQSLVSNIQFMSDFISYCTTNLTMAYPFSFDYHNDKITVKYHIDDFIKYYEEFKMTLKPWQIGIYKILKHYTSEKYLNKKLAEKISGTDFTYNYLKEYLLIPNDIFETKIKNDKAFGLKLYDLIYKKISYLNVLEQARLIFRLEEEQLSLVEKNLDLLKYYYEPHLNALDDFPIRDTIKGDFSLNNELVKEIMNSIPEDFDDLQKAYYIYYRLCEMFYYDEEYFCYSFGTIPEKRKAKPFVNHSNIKRLNDLEPNSGVICNEITMIYVKFLRMLHIPYQILGYNNSINVRYGKTHMKVRFKVGDFIVDADAGHGIYNSDMSSAKIFQEINSFELSGKPPKRVVDQFNVKKRTVDKYIAKNAKENEFNDALMIYEKFYAMKSNLSFYEKVNILRELIQNTKQPFIVMFSWVDELTEKIFGEHNNQCHVEFMINNNPTNKNQRYELVAVIMFNKDSTLKSDYLGNSYLVIKEDRHELMLDCFEFQKKIDNMEYDYTDKDRKKKYCFWEDNNGKRFSK